MSAIFVYQQCKAKVLAMRISSSTAFLQDKEVCILCCLTKLSCITNRKDVWACVGWGICSDISVAVCLNLSRRKQGLWITIYHPVALLHKWYSSPIASNVLVIPIYNFLTARMKALQTNQQFHNPCHQKKLITHRDL